MGKNVTQQLIEAHRVEGRLEPGDKLEISDVRNAIKQGQRVDVANVSKDEIYVTKHALSSPSDRDGSEG